MMLASYGAFIAAQSWKSSMLVIHGRGPDSGHVATIFAGSIVSPPSVSSATNCFSARRQSK